MRRYAELVEVHRRDEDPAQFLWRGRLHLVRTVLARWIEAGGWWRLDEAGPPMDRERETWRVEAAAGASARLGVYDLCFEPASGRWWLARVLD